MLKRLIEFSLANPFIVIVAACLTAASGVYSAILLPVDAVPDMTNVQVTVITNAGSLSPVEVERYWRDKFARFEKLAIKIADRRVRNAADTEMIKPGYPSRKPSFKK